MIVGNIVLFGWPVVVAFLFVRYDPAKAIVAALLFGYLFLPEQLYFNVPVLPTLEKHTVPALAALLCVLLSGQKGHDKALAGWVPRGMLPRLLLLTLFLSAFLTVMTNQDPLQYGPVSLEALRPYHALSVMLSLLVGLIPFLLARKYLAYPQQQQMLLAVFVTAGVIYSFLALFEVRMSPQLNNMVYGFFPHSFLQHMRGDGFRPLVFLNHGLWLAIFFTMTILAAFSLSRATGISQPRKFILAGLWLLLTLSVSNSLGALAIALVLIPVALLFGVRMQLVICALIALVVLVYPALRSAGMVPVDAILAWAEGIEPARASSFGFRVENEDVLLAHAQERPLFGWGGSGRNLLFDELGQPTAVTDGYWIIIIGQGGWARYLAEFGLLCLPAVIAAITAGKSRYGFETAGLMLMLAANLIDLLPNATMTPLTWLLVGAIWGRIELGSAYEAEATGIMPARQRLQPVYTRFNGGDQGGQPSKGHYARRRPT